jgi:hypothetical protein
VDLTELSRKTAIDRRKLRYVIDHGLVPRLHIEIVGDEVGRPRHFAADVGFAIVSAAKLLDLGLPHATIRLFLSGLLVAKLKTTDSQPALVAVLQGNLPAVATLADGQWVRLTVGSEDLPWINPATRSQPKNGFRPITTVVLDIGQIRDTVFTGP